MVCFTLSKPELEHTPTSRDESGSAKNIKERFNFSVARVYPQIHNRRVNTALPTGLPRWG